MLLAPLLELVPVPLLAEVVATGVPVEEVPLVELLLAEVVAAGVPVEDAPLLDDVVVAAVAEPVVPWPWVLPVPCPVIGMVAEIPAGITTRCPGTSGRLVFIPRKSRKFVPLKL